MSARQAGGSSSQASGSGDQTTEPNKPRIAPKTNLATPILKEAVENIPTGPELAQRAEERKRKR